MEYTLSVQQSSPRGIVGRLDYYDTSYGVVLAKEEDEKTSFMILTSANNSVGDDFRLEMDAAGQILEYVMRNGERSDVRKPNVLSKVDAGNISQSEFLYHVADVLSVL